jgi:hypothetical protein
LGRHDNEFATEKALKAGLTDEDQMPTENDVLLPELNSLPKDRLIEFVENIIRRYENNEFEWDTDTRSHIYTPQLN